MIQNQLKHYPLVHLYNIAINLLMYLNKICGTVCLCIFYFTYTVSKESAVFKYDLLFCFYLLLLLLRLHQVSTYGSCHKYVSISVNGTLDFNIVGLNFIELFGLYVPGASLFILTQSFLLNLDI